MLNRWVPPVFSASCSSVSNGKFGETSEFFGCLYGNLCGFLGEYTGVCPVAASLEVIIVKF